MPRLTTLFACPVIVYVALETSGHRVQASSAALRVEGEVLVRPRKEEERHAGAERATGWARIRIVASSTRDGGMIQKEKRRKPAVCLPWGA